MLLKCMYTYIDHLLQLSDVVQPQLLLLHTAESALAIH